MDFISDIIDEDLNIFLLHLELLKFILQFAHLLLLLKYCVFLFLEECVEVAYAILISLLFCLDTTQRVGQLLDLMLTSLLEIFDIPLEFANLLLIFDQLLLVSKFSIAKAVQASLLGLV